MYDFNDQVILMFYVYMNRHELARETWISKWHDLKLANVKWLWNVLYVRTGWTCLGNCSIKCIRAYNDRLQGNLWYEIGFNSVAYLWQTWKRNHNYLMASSRHVNEVSMRKSLWQQDMRNIYDMVSLVNIESLSRGRAIEASFYSKCIAYYLNLF